jgi:hypothetical protein
MDHAMTAVPESVLVVGSGSIARRHIRNLLALGASRVDVVTRRNVAGEDPFSDSRVHVLPETPDTHVAVAVVATATNTHLATARGLVAAGTHVLIEKPLAAAVTPDLQLLADEAEARGTVVRVAYNMRLLPVIERVKALVADGAIGRPLFARIEVGQWLPDWRPERDYRESYSVSAERGGGVALDLSHEVDYMMFLFGRPENWTVRHAKTGLLDLDCEDVFEGIYLYPMGFTCSVHLDYLERTPRRRMRVVGSTGEIECDIVGRRLTVRRGSATEISESPEMFDMSATYPAELEAFLGAVHGEPTNLATLDDGREVLRLLADPGEADCDV